MRKTKTFCCLTAAILLAGCQTKSEAGTTDPHGAYTPEEARAAAQMHLQGRPAPRSPASNAKAGQGQ